MLLIAKARTAAITAVLAGAVGLITVTAPAATSSTVAEAVVLGAESAAAIPGSYIVVLKDEVLKDDAALRGDDIAARARTLTSKHKGNLRHVYRHALRGFAATMSEQEAKRLAADPTVDYVEQDQVVRAAEMQESPPSWSLDRIDQRALPLTGSYSHGETGAGVTAYVIDSGIRITHADFGGRARYGWDALDDDPVADDCNGHGTHVAGTIGGKLHGVAKAVRLVAVRAYDCRGLGATSTTARGIDWVTAYAVRPAVANISVEVFCPGGPGTCNLDEGRQALNSAITNSIDSGIPYAVAAGNQNMDACGAPIASTPMAVTVGATTATDARSASSNWGPCVNIFAPGVDVTSAWHTSDTATNLSSGTSMAAPHVAGVMALIRSRNATWANAAPAELTDEIVNRMATRGVVTNIAGTSSTDRLLFTAPPPAAGGSPVAVARNADGRLQLFGVNKEGQIFYRWQSSPGANSWSYWRQPPNNTVWRWHSVAADTDVTNRIQLVGIRREETVFHLGQSFPNSDFWSAWSLKDGRLTSAALARDRDGRGHLFGTNATGDIWTRSQTAPGSNEWSAWGTLGYAFAPGVRLRSIAAETDGDGVMHVFVLDSRRRIWHTYQDPAHAHGWSPWWWVDGALSSVAAAHNPDGRIVLFGTDDGGKIYQRHQAPNSDNGYRNNWNSWNQLDGSLRSVAAEANADGRVQLFGVNSTGQVWHRSQWFPGSYTWSAWSKMDGILRP